MARRRDADRTKAEILDAAADEFATLGFRGARVEEIAAKTHTAARMIYYHFGSKENLYLEVLESAYRGIRAAEQQIDVRNSDPVTAMRELAELSFDHHVAHASFVRLVTMESMNGAQHIRKLPAVRDLSAPILVLIDDILARGGASGVFRTDVDSTDVHLVISSFCVFPSAGGKTFETLFDRDLTGGSADAYHRAMIGDVVIAWLRPPSA